MSGEMTLTLNSPITDEQWDAITDVDFEHTDRIWFKTKHGKEVEFVKRKRGQWIKISRSWLHDDVQCSKCGNMLDMNGVNAGRGDANFCPNCGADMRGESE